MSQQRTILITAPYFPPYGGGLERYASEIANRLHKDHNWRVVVVTSGERYGADLKEELDGLIIYRLSYRLKFSNTPFSFSWFSKIRKILKTENPSILNVHAPVPGIGDITAYLKKRRPLIVTYHSGSMRKGQPFYDLLVWLYEHGPMRHLLKKADQIICSSDFVRFNFLGKYQNKSITITPAVDANIFKPDPNKKSKRPTILFVAGLSRSEQHKGLYTLLKSIKLLKQKISDICLLVIGDGDMREEYGSYVRKLGIKNNVEFRGRLAGQDLVNAYQEAWVFALPTSNDSFSMVILEAMSCKLPVVSTFVGGIPSLVDDGKTGFLVSLDDKDALVTKLIDLFSSNQNITDFGKTGQEKVVKYFDWNSRVILTQKIIEELLMHKNLLIVQISPYYPPHLGGLELVAEKTSELLAKRNNHVLVLASSNKLKGYVEKKENLTIKRLASFDFAHTPIAPTLFWHLMWLPKKSIIHFHLSQIYWPELMFLFAKLKRIPYIIHFHGDVGPSGFFGQLFVVYKKYIQGALLRAAEKVIVLSQEQIPFINEKYKVPKKNIIFVPNGVDEVFFTITKTRRVYESPLKLLFVGRISIQKRVDRLLETMKLLDIPAMLTIVGDGEDRKKMEELASQLRLNNVSFVGRKNKGELLKYYACSDVFIITSDFEGMPLVVLEAMAAGLPVIGSNVQGIRELVSDVGVLVDNPSPSGFAKQISRLLKADDQFAMLSQKSVEKAQQYSWDKTVSMLEEVYKNVLQ